MAEGIDSEKKATREVYLDGGKIDRMVFQMRADPKSCNRMAAKGIQFRWRWDSVTISANLDIIWEISD